MVPVGELPRHMLLSVDRFVRLPVTTILYNHIPLDTLLVRLFQELGSLPPVYILPSRQKG